MRSVVDANLNLQGTVDASTLVGQRHRAQRALHAPFRHRRRTRRSRRAAPARAGAGPSIQTHDSASLRRASQHSWNAARREQHRADGRQRRSRPARHLRSARAGRARGEVERGEFNFEGKRYVITRGTIDFNNPTRIEPFFDIETETQVRVPSQTYRVMVRVDRHDGALHADLHVRSAADRSAGPQPAVQRRRAGAGRRSSASTAP